MKNSLTKILIAIGLFAAGFLSGYLTYHYFFKPSKPVYVDEKRIKNLPDSLFVDEFEREFRSKNKR